MAGEDHVPALHTSMMDARKAVHHRREVHD
jgi:hypothetical protein